MKYLDPEATAEKMKRRERRTTGYSAGRPGVPKYSPAKSSKDEEPAAPEGKKHSNLPEPVRQKRLAEFRRTLFEKSLDKKGRVRPSEAADFPDASQERCEHPYEELRWGANAWVGTLGPLPEVQAQESFVLLQRTRSHGSREARGSVQ